MKKIINILWLKKNLRTKDNQCLSELDPNIPTVAVYFFESDIIQETDFSDFHLQFITSSLLQLEISLKKIGIPLLYIPYNAVDGLKYIGEYYTINTLYSHEETGNLKSYSRDLEVIKYCKNQEIILTEYPTNGVVRKLESRDSWNTIWEKRMNTPMYRAVCVTAGWDENKKIFLDSRKCREYYKKLFQHIAPERRLQKGGEQLGLQELKSFLEQRSVSYMYHISRPFESQKSCSRLSPYITYGCLSLKYVCKETIQRISELRENDSLAAKNHIKSLSNFLSRLHWQSHFIQKLEDEPEIEKRNLNPDFNRIRIETDQKLIDAVFSAQSGIPYIDAIMKELYITGWTNFRSRATLVSFLCNTCMQPWQSFAERLACLFTDYEPGIHYSQLQMQAATTGINTIRIYNPVYNGNQKDAEGKFIYQYMSELRNVPIKYIHEPHLWDKFETLRYPLPIIDIKSANREAKDLLWNIKGHSSKETKDKIIKKHASRSFHKNKKNKRSITKSICAQKNENQITLF